MVRPCTAMPGLALYSYVVIPTVVGVLPRPFGIPEVLIELALGSFSRAWHVLQQKICNLHLLSGSLTF